MPDWRPEIRARLTGVRLSPAREAEIIEELSQHLEDRWREQVAAGADPEIARQQALGDFRGTEVLGRYLAPHRRGRELSLLLEQGVENAAPNVAGQGKP